MEQIIIKVVNNAGLYVTKDIMDSDYSERLTMYNVISKGQMMSLVEKLLGGVINGVK